MQQVLKAKVHLLEENPESASNGGAAKADQKIQNLYAAAWSQVMSPSSRKKCSLVQN